MFLVLFSVAIGLYEGLRKNPYSGCEASGPELLFSDRKLKHKKKHKKPSTGLYFSKPRPMNGGLFGMLDAVISPNERIKNRIACR